MEENKGLTLEKFKEMWDESKNFNLKFASKLDYNIVVDVNSTEIKADNYEVNYGDRGNIFIILFYRGFVIAKIRLENITDVF